MLETTECVSISNNGRDYTDCMEFSLLRFCQMVFYSQTEILDNKFSLFNTETNPKVNINDDLKNWISRYPKIYPKASHYYKKEGVMEREAWAQFVSDRTYFEYYRPDGAELFTNIHNIIVFCNELLGLNIDMDTNDDEFCLQMISNKLSVPTKKIEISIKEQTIIRKVLPISNIKCYLSKPQDDIHELKDGDYPIIFENCDLNLVIGNYNYTWTLYGVYFEDKNLVSNKFITGHSVINNN